MGQIGNRIGVAKIVSRCQGGGDKKAGIAPTATGQMLSVPFAWRAALGGLANGCSGSGSGRANGGSSCNGNFKISTVNQLGGIGRHRSMYLSNADGAQRGNILANATQCKRNVPQNFLLAVTLS